jgi:hypothetical protein
MIQDTQKQNENNAGTDRFFLKKNNELLPIEGIAICQLIVNKIKGSTYNQKFD